MFFLSLTILFSITACKKPSKIKVKKTYFPSGKIETYGHYLNDSVPVDTFYIFYENGNLERKIALNSFGKLNGITQLYFENGIDKRTSNYINGLIQGIETNYDSIGNLDFKAFYYNNKMIGDIYQFENNKMICYKFYDFKDRLVNRIDYDSSGKVKKEVNQLMYIDSIKLTSDKNGLDTCKLLLIISNPIYKSNKINIEYLDRSAKIIAMDSMSENNLHMFFKERLFKSNELGAVKITGEQYDSLTLRRSILKGTLKIDD